MRKILETVKDVARKLSREKVAGRAALAAVVNYLVLSGVVDADQAEGVEEAILTAVNLYALVSARQAVRPADEDEPIEPVDVPDVEVQPTPSGDQTG